MPAQPLTYADVEETIAEQIEALDASAYTQGSTPAAWHEASAPLSVLVDPSSLGHLNFSVWISSAPNSDLERDAEIDGYVWVTARVRVAFTFRLRPRQQTADGRQAIRAAHDVVRALMGPWPSGDGCALVQYVDGLQQALSLDGEYLLITQDYAVSFDLDIATNRITDPP